MTTKPERAASRCRRTWLRLPSARPWLEPWGPRKPRTPTVSVALCVVRRNDSVVSRTPAGLLSLTQLRRRGPCSTAHRSWPDPPGDRSARRGRRGRSRKAVTMIGKYSVPIFSSRSPQASACSSSGRVGIRRSRSSTSGSREAARCCRPGTGLEQRREHGRARRPVGAPAGATHVEPVELVVGVEPDVVRRLGGRDRDVGLEAGLLEPLTIASGAPRPGRPRCRTGDLVPPGS